MFVHWRMCSAVIGEACKVSISRTMSAGCAIFDGVWGSGSRLSESAFACLSLSLYDIV